MDFFEKKYRIEEGSKVKDYHRSRRMFCVYQDRLHIAKPNLEYSHAIWMEEEGIISKEDDSLMDSLVRGVVDKKGDVYFYVGYNFDVTQDAEGIFFNKLEELASSLELNPSSNIFGGLIKQENSTNWPPRKDYGKIEENL